MSVRLKAFRELEHFRAATGATTLTCSLERRDGVVSHVCRLNGEVVDPPRVAGNDVHIALARALFASNPRKVLLDWVDYWR